ncbi:hypothetical protein JCGZ_20525 [Jatropha curcas]|uniref:Late embryogenesis abundant protein LEA-2 subgroup domain-containing protein n=1 Tax=Jatropha curcas TaxID=180498 RepID=A0A067K0P4_JATCU|nr:uncharacterized protein LOC105646042 [Jatropha curcas]KDP25369.1 hypothetical protein JCGZ_20525 [Jatropha curcas]
MAETEQAKPLAPTLFQSRSDEEEAISTHLELHQNRKFLKCCGCFTALWLILAVTILVMFFTVFHVQEPVIKINNINLLQLNLYNNGTLRTDTNVKIAVEVSVKNPNVASFKFDNGTTTVLYGGVRVGEAITRSGKAKARRTIYMNVTVDLSPEKILGVESFGRDVSSGALAMNSSTVIGGKVKIAKIIKKYIIVEVNCSVTFNLTSQQNIQSHCRPHFI